MNTSKLARALLATFALVALTACGGGGEGEGSSDMASSAASKKAVRAPIAGTAVHFKNPQLAFGLAMQRVESRRSVQVTNVGKAVADFSLMENLPAGFSTVGCNKVAPGATCSMTVVFRPDRRGRVTAQNIFPVRADVIKNRLSITANVLPYDGCGGRTLPGGRSTAVQKGSRVTHCY